MSAADVFALIKSKGIYDKQNNLCFTQFQQELLINHVPVQAIIQIDPLNYEVEFSASRGIPNKRVRSNEKIVVEYYDLVRAAIV